LFSNVSGILDHPLEPVIGLAERRDPVAGDDILQSAAISCSRDAKRRLRRKAGCINFGAAGPDGNGRIAVFAAAIDRKEQQQCPC
jgi:hypothetical protein